MTRRVEAYWAVETKEPGDECDYRILAHGPGEVELYEDYLGANAPGSPTTEVEGRVDSLPRATVGLHGSGAPWLSLSVMRWSAHRDRDRRAIATTRLVVLAHHDLIGTGYAAWARAVELAALPPDGSRIVLDVDDGSPSPETVPVPSREVSPQWAAGVAALLLDGRVVVTGVEAGMAARLALVDAVTDLLPEGCRAHLTFSTWAVDPDRRPHRLCFAERGTAIVATEVHPDREPPVPRSEAARRYRDIAREHLREDRGAEFRQWLADAVDPMRLTDAAVALACIREFDLPRRVAAEIRAGAGRPADARRALRRGLGAFAPEDLHTVFACALEAADLPELGELVELWCPPLRRAVAATASGDTTGAVPAFVDVAAATGDLDELATATLGTHGTATPAAAELVVDILEHHRWPAWPHLRRRIGEDVDVIAALVLRSDPPSRLPRLLDWLTTGHRDGPRWAAALRDLVAGADGRAETVAALLRGWRAGDEQLTAAAVVVFGVAAAHGAFDALPDVAWAAIAHALAGPGDRHRTPLARLLATSDEDRSADVRARLDVVRRTGRLPFPPGDLVDPEAYVRALRRFVRKPTPARKDALLDDVVERRLDACATTPGRAALLLAARPDPASDRWRSTLCRLLERDDGRLVARLDDTSEAWSPDSVVWWADLARLRGAVRDGLHPDRAAPVLARLLATEPEVSRGLWADALKHAVSVERLPRFVRTVLDASHLLVEAHLVDADRVDLWTSEVLLAVRHGEFGTAVASSLPGVLDAELRRVTEAGPESRRVEHEVRDLERQIGELEDALAERRRESGRLARRREATAALLRRVRHPGSETPPTAPARRSLLPSRSRRPT